MTDLLSQAHVVLRSAGYNVRVVEVHSQTVLAFEDAVISGFLLLFETPEELLERWADIEASVLRRFATSFQMAGEKAWNVYLVCLSRRPATSRQLREASWIDENLNRTRKIAASGVAGREELVRALLPVLPLRFQPEFKLDNVREKVRSRIEGILPEGADLVLDDSVPPEEVVRFLRSRA